MRIIDGFMPLIGYVVSFRGSAAQTRPHFQQVKADIQRLLQLSEDITRGCSSEDYDLSRFIVCAWVDETLLGSQWEERGQWQKEQLQRIYYNTTDAGVEAFEKLNQLGLQQREVRELYYYCLALGFRGRFISQGDDFLLEQLKSSNLKLHIGGDTGVPALDHGELFPGAYPAGGTQAIPQHSGSRYSLVLLVSLVAPLLLFSLLYLVYRFTLDSVGHKFY